MQFLQKANSYCPQRLIFSAFDRLSAAAHLLDRIEAFADNARQAFCKAERRYESQSNKNAHLLESARNEGLAFV
jgi:hypothetical protein